MEEENKIQPAQDGLSVNEWSSVTGTARRGRSSRGRLEGNPGVPARPWKEWNDDWRQEGEG
jgi:hypothetical protein